MENGFRRTKILRCWSLCQFLDTPKWKNNMSCYNDVTESLTTSFTSSTMD